MMQTIGKSLSGAFQCFGHGQNGNFLPYFSYLFTSQWDETTSKEKFIFHNIYFMKKFEKWYFVSKMRKKCSSDSEKLLKFKAEGREFAKILRSLKGQKFI